MHVLRSASVTAVLLQTAKGLADIRSAMSDTNSVAWAR